MKFTYYTFLPIVLLATSSHAGGCGSRARVYKVQADAHYNEGLLDCPNGYGDVGCPFGTAAHDVQQHPPVNDGDQCVTTVRNIRIIIEFLNCLLICVYSTLVAVRK